MVLKKRVLALALAASLVFGSAFSVAAATPSAGGDSAVTPGNQDKNQEDHHDNTVVSKVVNGKATVTAIHADTNSTAAKYVKISTAEDPATKKDVPITAINGNVFNSAKGRIVTNVTITPKGSTNIVIKSKAFNKSKVKKLTLNLDKLGKVTIKNNAFSKLKTSKQKMTIVIKAKKASQVTLGKKAFAKLGKKSVIKVSKTMSKAQFKKLKKKLVKAGFKGKIKRA